MNRVVDVFAGVGSETWPDDSPADVEFAATFRARQLLHRERPRTAARVWGGGARVVEIDEDRRRNLPRRVEPDREYRDVRLERRIGGTLETRDR